MIANPGISVRLLVTLSFGLFSCGSSSGDKSSPPAQSYDFSAAGKMSLKLKSSTGLASDGQSLADGPTLCSSVVCFTPTSLVGKVFGTGFLIQSAGNGMVAYFGQTNWSGITAASTMYSFDSAAPAINSGSLFCCNGSGDLSSENTYIESVIYLFGYLDATFTVAGVTSNTSMNREFTVRFVIADDAVSGGKRGDVLLSDPADGVFKWIDTSISAGGIVGDGTLVATRPTTPVTMNKSVTEWTNSFGANQGNQSIPVIYAPVLPEPGSAVYQIKEADLKAEGKTYTFGFDPSNFVMFPELLTADKNSIYSYTQLLKKIHLGGLPHSAQAMGVGNPAGTELVVTGP